MGARRYLFGDPDDRAKDGLNHKIQGAVANLMAWCLIQITRTYPAASLILNKHDGAIVAFPDEERASERSSVCERVKQLVEQEREVGQGVTMGFPATWKVWNG